MLKIKRLNPDDVESLEFNAYKKLVRPLFAALKKGHLDPNAPCEFFILTNFEFADKAGKKSMIFVPGKQTAAWKKFLKTKFREDKKNLLMGKCYVTQADGEMQLNLIPVRGLAKMMLIKRQGKRLFALAKLQVQIAGGAAEATAAMGGRVSAAELSRLANEGGDEDYDDDDDLYDDDNETDAADRNDAKAEAQELAAMLKGIKSGVAVLKDVAAKIKSNAANTDDAERAELVYEEIQDFFSAFDEADPQAQKQLQAVKNKLQGQMGQVEKLMQHLQPLLDSRQEDNNDDGDEEENEGNNSTRGGDSAITAEMLGQIQESMSASKTQINQLLRELNLDELLRAIA